MTLRIALRNLLRTPRRTLAVLFTVATGVGSLFIFHGFNTGIMNQYRDNTVHARYGHGQVMTRGYRDRARAEPWRSWMADWRRLTADLLAIPGVEQVFPRVEFGALIRKGDVTVNGRGQGIDGREEAAFFTTMNVEQGLMLSDEQDGILLGRGLAAALQVTPGDKVAVIGTTVDGVMNEVELRVVGVFHTGAADFDNTMFRIQLEQALTLLGTDRVESIAIGLASIDDWEVVAATVDARYPALEAVSFATLDAIYYQHSVDWLGSQFGVIQIIIIVIVVLGIFNTVSSGILERKQEIGNLRANGESSLEVMALLALEGLCHGVLGAIIGCGLAWLIDATILRHGILMPPAPGITRQFHVLIELQPDMALTTSAMGIAAALLGTLVAGWKVATMPIGDALRAV